MGLLDILGSLTGGAQQQQSNDPKALLLQAAIGLLSGSKDSGGLQGLLSTFQNAGLGNEISSWIGTGQNLPVSGEQIQTALGGEQLEQLAQSSGLSQADTANHLADLLPGLIDKLTPNGQLPQGGIGEVVGMLGQLMGHGNKEG